MEYSEKKVNSTEICYQTGRVLATPVLKTIYKPIIINKDFIPKDDSRGVIYAPNHRSTLDPFAIISATNDAIHWVALKRFFDAEDSIFNNSKNPLLCQLTKFLFTTMGFVPIDRNSMNLESLRLLSRLLKDYRNIGIFPEGTTNKHPELYDIGPVKPGISVIAKKNDAWIQPISILWTKSDKITNKVIVNFREPFLSFDLDKEEIIELWIDRVQKGIDENKEIVKNLQTITDDSSVKRLSLKIK